jgi:hypothetical protein
MSLVTLLLALGCGGGESGETRAADRGASTAPAKATTPGAVGAGTTTSGTAGAKPVAGAQADNTGVNERDRDGGTLTPPDQLENKADLALVEKVREALVGDDALSMNAKNVKVIVQNGVVTLRGPVASLAEKASVEAKAKAISGVVRVDNQLDVEGN